jgi:hypothetical protein
MERITQAAASRLAEYKRSHPELSIWQAKATGRWYAWVPDGDGCAGSAASGRTEAELLAKLDG